MSGREVESSVLTKAALLLKECQDNWNAEDRDAKLYEAVKLNQIVWTIFQGEISNEENPLPKELKQNILNLSAFIDKRLFDISAFPSPEKLTAVININLNIAAGLKSSPDEAK
jgi:flagellar protein FlaF